MPARAQRLFKHTAEHRRFKMQQLYAGVEQPPATAPTVLLWVPGGMALLLHVEAVIAAALRCRGYNVHAIICDAPYHACVRREITNPEPIADWGNLCKTCIATNRSVLDVMGIPYSHIGDFVPQEMRDEFRKVAAELDPTTVNTLTHRGLQIGHNVTSTITRFLQGNRLDDWSELVREYAYSALVTAEAAARSFELFKPARVFMSHGTYVDWGPALHRALQMGIPVTGWKASYLTSRFFFRHVEDPARIDFHKLSDRAWERLLRTPFSAKEEASLERFLIRRYHHRVSFDMKTMQEYTGDLDRFKARFGIDDGKPVWGIMAHINWDSVSDYSPMAYPTFDEWVIDTVNRVSELTDVQWLIKVHPIETSDNPAAGVKRLIETRFPNLPPHVRLIPPEEQISPLDFFSLLDGGVTVYGTSGLELAVKGKPVILAGEAHYGAKGFTYDGLDIESYRELLARAGSIEPLTAEQVRLARIYAHSYFVQRQIPLPIVRDPGSVWWAVQHEKRELLLPGKEPFLDFICDHLISGEDFIMDRELVELADSDAWT